MLPQLLRLTSTRLILNPKLNNLVKSGKLRKGSLVKLKFYLYSTFENKKVFFIMEADVILDKCDLVGVTKSYLATLGNVVAPVVGFDGSQVQPSGENFNEGAHSHSSAFSGSMNSGTSNIIQIAKLTDCQGKWTIKARVMRKAAVSDYNNLHGAGSVFSFDLLDSKGGRIRVICFSPFVHTFYNRIESGRVYMISDGRLKQANEQFNNLGHKKEIVLDSRSIVQLCDDDKSIPPLTFSFKTIVDIGDLDCGMTVDLIAIVSSISSTTSVTKKDGNKANKRTLQLKDRSGRSVEFTMWGSLCNFEGERLQTMCDSGLLPVLAVKAGKINNFKGKSVGTIPSTQLLIDPDIHETRELRTWFDSGGKSAPAISLSTGCTYVRKTICQIKDENLGTNEKPDWITINATIRSIIAHQISYPSCPLMNSDKKCKKKLDGNKNGDSTWHCTTCDKSFKECDYQYVLSIVIQDHTGKLLVTAFEEEVGQEIIGRSAKEMYLMKHIDKDVKQETEVVKGAFLKTYTFRLRVEKDNFRDRNLVQSIVEEAEKYNLKTETKHMLDLAKQEESDMGAGGY